MRRVALQIEDPDLAEHVARMLAEEADLVVLDAHNHPDVVVSDGPLLHEEPPTIILGDGHHMSKALDAGAGGVLPRDCSAADLVLAIEAAARGYRIVPRMLMRRPPSGAGWSGSPDKLSSWQETNRLTAREREVLRLLAEGASNKLIARRLGISVHTAKFHVASIATKLDATGRTDAVAQAVRLGLIML